MVVPAFSRDDDSSISNCFTTARPLYAGMRADVFPPNKKREEIMTTSLTLSDSQQQGGGFDRRKILTGAAALAASAVTIKTASAASVAPLGQTGAPTTATQPCRSARFPAPAIRILAWSR
ncbi:hypothetical protein ACF1BQ_022990 [Bradyrhizobium sp. RDT10]